MLELDTENRIAVGIDRTGGIIRVLTPRGKGLYVEVFTLDDPDPANTDAAEFKLLTEHMDEHVDYEL